ncbi:MAG: PAS domain-containing protein, partial [Candidatus Marinimicrobia bacterium]|nr:PAS domain-containing protein [Candidatus Neomarinimicrobiota bacterium]
MAEKQMLKPAPEFVIRSGASPALRWLGGVALALATVGGGWLAWLVWSQPVPLDPAGLTAGVILIGAALLLGYLGAVLRRERRALAVQAGALADSQSRLARYALLAETTREIILLVRQADGRILEANRAATAAYQYERDALHKRHIRDLSGGGPPAHAEEQMRAAGASGLLYAAEHR